MTKLIRIVGSLVAVFALAFVVAAYAPRASAQVVSGTDSAVITPSTTAVVPQTSVIPSTTTVVPTPVPTTVNVFPVGGGVFGGGIVNGSRLGNLALLDQLFSGTTGVLSNNGSLNLGDLALINQAFNNSDIRSAGRFSDLFALGTIFGPGTGILSGNGTSLGDVLVLDQLFR